ncbi:hypothetical protein K469DRAFT_701159 [Zopfia rhizophila CBS 207.26]|uniref:Uncharacterized protein n=1 Tax=Zopfia rhizophila CBS 207.26 TaxID=1314779 RepID=A0A6A6EDR1_9PEZI|nr:hypothetical protein K469DRAFT_701159 [Zopfia rhizophila CBS 207.26]
MHVGFRNYPYPKSHNLQLAPHSIKWSRIGYSHGYHSAIAERHSRPRDSVPTRWSSCLVEWILAGHHAAPLEAHTEGRRSHVIVRHFLDWTGCHTTNRCGCELTTSDRVCRAFASFVHLVAAYAWGRGFLWGVASGYARADRLGRREKGSRAGRHGG